VHADADEVERIGRRRGEGRAVVGVIALVVLNMASI